MAAQADEKAPDFWPVFLSASIIRINLLPPKTALAIMGNDSTD